MIDQHGNIRQSVTIDVDQEKAFSVFTGDMTSWWPSDHHIGVAPITEIVLEPREGGRWYSRHADGSETSTGYVVCWQAPSRIVITWQITARWAYDPDLVTTIEVRFVPEGPDRTRVEFEHRDLDAFGADTAEMGDLFDRPDAWAGSLAAFARVAGGSA